MKTIIAALLFVCVSYTSAAAIDKKAVHILDFLEKRGILTKRCTQEGQPGDSACSNVGTCKSNTYGSIKYDTCECPSEADFDYFGHKCQFKCPQGLNGVTCGREANPRVPGETRPACKAEGFTGDVAVCSGNGSKKRTISDELEALLKRFSGQ